MSMTKEEAIKWLEEIVQDTDTYWGSCSKALQKELDEEKQVFLLALSALRPITREQVEKVWRGEWLNFYNDFSVAECRKCGEFFEVSPDETPKEEFFKAFSGFYHFCPACGAAQTDEAVEMVMERMEKLKDADTNY